MSERVHPTAVISPRATLGAGVTIGPYCVIGEGVTLHDGVTLHNHVTVMGPTTLGAECEVYPYAVVGAEPQDRKYKGADTRVIVGARTRIREHATVHRGTEHGGGRTVIGDDCLIMVNVHVAHDCVIEDEVVIANNCMLGGHCLVERGATLGGGVAVHHFTSVGTLAFVGGMSRITKDVPPYVVVEGAPAEVRKLNRTALVRRKWSPEHVEELTEAFRRLFRNPDTPASQTVRALRAASSTPAVLRLCDFIERTQLGVYGRQREAERTF